MSGNRHYSSGRIASRISNISEEFPIRRSISAARVSSSLRTLHRTAALLLTPWVLMYGLSTLAMNHRHAMAKSGGAEALRLLQEFHKNSAFESDTFHSLVWAVSVDFFAFAMLFWLASGFWLWWKIPRARRMGGVSWAIGIGAFACFVFSI